MDTQFHKDTIPRSSVSYTVGCNTSNKVFSPNKYYQKLIHAPRGLQKNTSSAQSMSAKDPVTYATVQSAEKKQSQPQRKSSSHHELKIFAETKTKFQNENIYHQRDTEARQYPPEEWSLTLRR